ncbi:MAG: hypothetical protein H0W06_09630 [Chloroflexia bacterium]|nr:hypothetical protein [Chloroflexia bacterium]
MSDELAVRAITVDAARNRLTLYPHAHASESEPLPPGSTVTATIDVGTSGRLLGVELDGQYLAVDAPTMADTSLARGVLAPVELNRASDGSLIAVSLPRRGPDYEITYPSGNR